MVRINIHGSISMFISSFCLLVILPTRIYSSKNTIMIIAYKKDKTNWRTFIAFIHHLLQSFLLCHAFSDSHFVPSSILSRNIFVGPLPFPPLVLSALPRWQYCFILLPHSGIVMKCCTVRIISMLAVSITLDYLHTCHADEWEAPLPPTVLFPLPLLNPHHGHHMMSTKKMQPFFMFCWAERVHQLHISEMDLFHHFLTYSWTRLN